MSYTGAKLEEIIGIQNKLDEANNLRDALLDRKSAKNKIIDELDDLIGVLDEIDQRDIDNTEIEGILAKVKNLNDDSDALDIQSQKRTS